MVNTAQKGAALERKAMDILRQQGCAHIHRAVRTPVMRDGRIVGSQPNDIFGCFDVMALHPVQLRLIQVTVLSEVSRRKKKVEAVAADMPDVTVLTAEVWGWVEGRRDQGGQRFRVSVWSQRYTTWRAADDVEWIAPESAPKDEV